MAQGTGDANPCQHVLGIDEFDLAFETDNSVQFQQSYRAVPDPRHSGVTLYGTVRRSLSERPGKSVR